jgi:YgiT-type zinc finger domain-containing protein
MNCIYCRGKMERGSAPFHIDRKSYHLTPDGIPAWICAQCGEVFFDEAEVENIQEVIRALDRQMERIAVSA